MARKRVTAPQHNQLGVTFFQSGSLDLAIEQFTRATKRAPWVATYWLNLGVAFLDRGEVNEAEAALEKCLKLKPQNQSAYFHRAQIHTKRGDDSSAKAAYEKVIDLDSTTHLARRAHELLKGWRPQVIVGRKAARTGTREGIQARRKGLG
jgi:tetratricopeptide (TPR) repeat protein